MMKVAIITLLAAPCALAFTPANLVGVWSCVVEVSLKNLTPQNAAAPGSGIASPAIWGRSSKDNSEQRTIVFSAPAAADNSRRFEGRSYYHAVDVIDSKAMTEEHNFHGFMKNADEGVFFLDENAWNAECNNAAIPNALWTGPSRTAATGAGSIDQPGVFPMEYNADNTLKTGGTTGAITYLKGASTTPLVAGVPTLLPGWSQMTPTTDSITANDKLPKIMAGSYLGRGSCQTRPEGPWDFVMEDADHFTLTVDPTDLQLDNYQNTKANSNYSTINRVHSLEKCMRGLPLESNMCDKLHRSGVDSKTEKDNTCQGGLVCHMTSGTDNYGCKTEECCSIRPQPVYQPPPQQYYYPQPQYYQQPYPQWNQYRSPVFNYGR